MKKVVTIAITAILIKLDEGASVSVDKGGVIPTEFVDRVPAILKTVRSAKEVMETSDEEETTETSEDEDEEETTETSEDEDELVSDEDVISLAEAKGIKVKYYQGNKVGKKELKRLRAELSK